MNFTTFYTLLIFFLLAFCALAVFCHGYHARITAFFRCLLASFYRRLRLACSALPA